MPSELQLDSKPLEEVFWMLKASGNKNMHIQSPGLHNGFTIYSPDLAELRRGMSSCTEPKCSQFAFQTIRCK